MDWPMCADRDGVTPLRLAQSRRFESMVKLLE